MSPLDSPDRRHSLACWWENLRHPRRRLPVLQRVAVSMRGPQT